MIRTGRPPIGSTVRFHTSNDPRKGRTVEARVVGYRKDPRGGFAGWIETIDADDFERSVRPSRCEVVGYASAAQTC